MKKVFFVNINVEYDTDLLLYPRSCKDYTSGRTSYTMCVTKTI